MRAFSINRDIAFSGFFVHDVSDILWVRIKGVNSGSVMGVGSKDE